MKIFKLLLVIVLVICQTASTGSSSAQEVKEPNSIIENDKKLKGFYLLNDVDKLTSYLGISYNPKRNNTDHKEFCVQWEPSTEKASIRFYKSDVKIDLKIQKEFENSLQPRANSSKRNTVWKAMNSEKDLFFLTSELTGYSAGLLIFEKISKEDFTSIGKINVKPLSRGGFYEYKSMSECLKEVESLYKRNQDYSKP